MRITESLTITGMGEPLAFNLVGLSLTEPIYSFITYHSTEIGFLLGCTLWSTFIYTRRHRPLNRPFF